MKLTFTKCQRKASRIENMVNDEVGHVLIGIFKKEVNSESLVINLVAADSVHKF